MVQSPDDIMYPPGYNPGEDVISSRLEDRKEELKGLRDKAVRARELINSDLWKNQVSVWQSRMKSIIGQYNPTSPTALSDAVFGMGMLRQIQDDMNRPQEAIDRYEKKKDSYDKLVRSRKPK